MNALALEQRELDSAPPPMTLSPVMPHVLLAEDDADTRRLLAWALRVAGYDVVEAGDGIEVLDEMDSRIRSHSSRPFAVIILDVNMPFLTGLDLLAALRSAQWATPVILITAFGDEAIRAEARELGAFAILEKPRDLDELRTDVLRTLSLACAVDRKRSR